LSHTKYSMPDRENLYHNFKKNGSFYFKKIGDISKTIETLLNNFSLNCLLKYRVKNFDSFYEKILKTIYAGEKDFQINDILGIRIICPFLDDLEAAEKILSENFEILEKEKKSSNNSFSEFYYDSTHLLLKIPDFNNKKKLTFSGDLFEVQLRTILQDAWAEVEHELIYKADPSIFNDSIKRKLAALSATLTLSDTIFQEIRDYQKEILIQKSKRKKNLYAKIEETNYRHLTKNLKDEPVYEIEEEISFSSKSLDKKMFDALNAHSKGDYENALLLYTDLIDNFKLPDNVKSIIVNHRGMVFFIISEYEKSEKDFSEAIKYDKDNFRAFKNRSMTYRLLNKYDRALDDINHSLNLNSFQADAYYNKALILNDLNDFSKAIEECNKTINIKPDFNPAHKLRAILQRKIFQ